MWLSVVLVVGSAKTLALRIAIRVASGRCMMMIVGGRGIDEVVDFASGIMLCG